MKLYLDFQLGAGWEEVTQYTKPRWYFTDRASSTSHTHAVNILNFTLLYDADLFTAIRISTTDILVRLTDGASTLFTGYFKPSTDETYGGLLDLQEIQVEAEDFTEYLNKKVGEPGIAYKNYKIQDPAVPAQSIVHSLFAKIGLSTSYIDPTVTISGVIGAFTSNTEEDTALELLDTLLFEHGYVGGWTCSGLYKPERWIPTGTTVFEFNDDNVIGEAEKKSSIKEYEGASVTWYGLDTKLGTRIYTEDLPFDDDGDFSGYAILSNVYYPPEANVADDTTGDLQKVHQEYTDDGVRYKSSKYVQDAYEMNFALAHADFSEILLTENHNIEDHFDTGIVRDIGLFYNKKAQVRYHNPTAGSLLLYYMNITADVVYKRTEQIAQVQLVTDTTKLEDYKSRFIFDRDSADVLVKALANDTQYWGTTWTFDSEENVESGSFVHLNFSNGIEVDGCVLERKYDGYTEIYTYTVPCVSATTVNVTKRLVYDNAPSNQEVQDRQALRPATPSLSINGDSQFVYQGSFNIPNTPTIPLTLNVQGIVPTTYQWYAMNVSGVYEEIPGATLSYLNVPYNAPYLLPDTTILHCRVNDKWDGSFSITKKVVDEYRLQITDGLNNISYDQFELNPVPSVDQTWNADIYKNDVLQSSGVTYSWSCGGNLTASGVMNAKTFATSINSAMSANQTFIICSGTCGGKSVVTRKDISISRYDATLDWIEEWDATKEAMYTGDVLIGDHVITGRIYAGTLEDDPVHTGFKRLRTGFAFGNKIQIKGAATTEEKDGFIVVKDGEIVAYMDVDGNATWNGTVTTSGINASVGAINSELVIGENGWQAGGTGTPDVGDTQTFLNDKKMSVQEYDGNIWIDKISMGKQTLLNGVQYDLDIGGRSLSYDEQGNKIGLEIEYLASDSLIVKKGAAHINTVARDWWVDGKIPYEYNEARPAGDMNKDWATSCMSADGTKMLAGANNGRLYLSVNSGASWAEVQPAGDADVQWATSCMSADGTKMLAGMFNGRLYLSTTSGASWAEVQPAGDMNKNWAPSCMSADGTKILAGELYGRLYLSVNSGASWAEVQPAGDINENWYASCMSADGTKILVSSPIHRIYLSTTSGASWAEVQPIGDVDYQWIGASISIDGTKIIVTSRWLSPLFQSVFLSVNSGISWKNITPSGVATDTFVGNISADGNTVLVGEHGGRLYISTNACSSWVEIQPAGDADKEWRVSCMSADGTKILAGEGGASSGRLYSISKTRTLISSSTPNFPSAGEWKFVCLDINGNITLENATGTAAQRPTDNCYSKTAAVVGYDAVGKHGYYFSDSKRIIGAVHKVSATSWYIINNYNGREEIGETSVGKYYIDTGGGNWLGAGIIESGIDSVTGYHYRKFSDGVLECWGTATISTSILYDMNLGTYGWSLYYGDGTITWPIAFKPGTTPVCLINGNTTASSGSFATYGRFGSVTNSGATIQGYNYTSASIAFGWHAIGLWK
jgi:hypothetical protein